MGLYNQTKEIVPSASILEPGIQSQLSALEHGMN